MFERAELCPCFLQERALLFQLAQNPRALLTGVGDDPLRFELGFFELLSCPSPCVLGDLGSSALRFRLGLAHEACALPLGRDGQLLRLELGLLQQLGCRPLRLLGDVRCVRAARSLEAFVLTLDGDAKRRHRWFQ